MLAGMGGQRGIGRAQAAMAAALLALAVGASQAHAAQRYADPAGTGTACSAALPCDLLEAVNNAASTDEVIVGPGTYNPGNTALFVTSTMNVHGAAGQAAPLLNFSSPAVAAVQVSGSARVADLRIDVLTAGVALDTASTTPAERIYARTAGGANLACSVSEAVLIDSVCWAPNGLGEAIIAVGGTSAPTVTLRNVTAVGGSRGLDAFTTSMNQVLTVDAKNSIFAGPDADVESFPLQAGSTVNVNLANSNYDSAVDGGDGAVTAPGSGSNQTAAPLFANATLGDFHQLASSPTVDAGAADGSLGTLDFEGDQRSIDATPGCSGDDLAVPDIGADELFVPIPPCAPPTQPKGKKCKKKKKKQPASAKKRKKKSCKKKRKKKKKKK